MNKYLSSLHVHSTFCDGKNTPEEIVLSAIEKGFSTIGFSSHGYTPYDLRYCMKDTSGYIAEINRLKEVYKGKIRILLGVEEDAFAPVDRSQFDYIIGSSHYYFAGGVYYPIDSTHEHFKKCLEVFNHDVVKMAEIYYSNFYNYLEKRKPDIIGHFDLITKFDEIDGLIFLGNEKYRAVVEYYAQKIAKLGCLFEVNTGAITRNLRTTPYPSPHLLEILKKQDAKLILGADSHIVDTLDGAFKETTRYLSKMGFKYAYAPSDDGFVPYPLK